MQLHLKLVQGYFLFVLVTHLPLKISNLAATILDIALLPLENYYGRSSLILKKLELQKESNSADLD